jgi:hypothetical protein
MASPVATTLAAAIALVRADVSGALKNDFNQAIAAWAVSPTLVNLVAQLDLFIAEAAVIVAGLPADVAAKLAPLAAAQATAAAAQSPVA